VVEIDTKNKLTNKLIFFNTHSITLYVYACNVIEQYAMRCKNIYKDRLIILNTVKIKCDTMTLEKSTVKLNINPERGSGSIYLKKAFVELIDFEVNKELLAIYDTEKKELCIKAL